MPNKYNKRCHTYKKWEEHWNKKMKRLANCHTVVVLVGEVVNTHLNQVQEQRYLFQQWLDKKCFPNKEEVAEVAKRVIKNEEKLDQLDELVYDISQRWNNKRQVITELKEAVEETGQVLEAEYFTNRDNRFKQLKAELNDVKSLF